VLGKGISFAIILPLRNEMWGHLKKANSLSFSQEPLPCFLSLFNDTPGWVSLEKKKEKKKSAIL
jgi:hypothetical protein